MEVLGSAKVGLMTCLAQHCRECRLIFSDVINLFIGGVPSPPRSSPLSCVFSLAEKLVLMSVKDDMITCLGGHSWGQTQLGT